MKNQRCKILNSIFMCIAMGWISGIGILQAQTPAISKIEKVEVRLSEPVPVKIDEWRNRWENRILSPGIKADMETDLLAFFRQRGYYFARIDSSGIITGSKPGSSSVYFEITPGRIMKLSEVHIENRDSLPENIAEKISEISGNYTGVIYTDFQIKRMFEQIIAFMENDGFPLARVQTTEFQISEREKQLNLELGLAIHPGDSVRLQYIDFSPQKFSENSYLKKTLRFRSGQPYRQKTVSNYTRILSRQEFIKTAQPPVLMQDGDGNYFLKINLEEAPSTALDGIIGYIPPPSNLENENGYFTGLVNIGIRNLFGTGRKLQIFWQKPDQFSDEFRLFYLEPFTLGLPLHTGVGMNRLVRDTTYIEWQYHFNVEIPVNDAISAFMKVSSREVAPDSLASRVLRLPRTQTLITETGLRWDNRDNLKNPRKGTYLDVSWSLGQQKNVGPDYLIREDSLPSNITVQKVTGNMELLIPVFHRQVISSFLHVSVLNSQGGKLNLPDLIWFGGATSVRGYREAQFYGDRVAWLNTEYRFILNPQTRFFLFTDNAYFSRKIPEYHEQWLNAYGVGIRLPNPLGIVQVDFGLSRGDPLREAKIHFRLINEF